MFQVAGNSRTAVDDTVYRHNIILKMNSNFYIKLMITRTVKYDEHVVIIMIHVAINTIIFIL